ncbi:MAG: hypothetical protein D6808_03810 [Candidatus Dadabacteria bacterium]|nr:MAG: hypothetical protein D6808_03810 [Candidatus Dadabacteria bacterium]
MKEEIKIEGRPYRVSEIGSLSLSDLKTVRDSETASKAIAFIKEFFGGSQAISVKTSGSTSAPKTFFIPKAAMLKSAELTGRALGWGDLSGLNALLCLSPDKIGGMMCIVRAYLFGFNLIIGRVSSHPFSDIKEDVHYTSVVPYQLYSELEYGKSTALSSLRWVLVGGGAVSRELEALCPLLKNACVYHTFGMTETGSTIALRRISPKREESFSPLQGVSLSTDDRGCLVVSAPYLPSSPLITNDIVSIEKDGSFRWIGRYDNIINTGGVKIHAEKLEEKISGILGEKCAVTAIKDIGLGEKIVLVLESKVRNSDEIKAKLRGRLNRYEIPKEVLVGFSIPEAANGKIDRKALKAAVAEGN